ncbi:C-myc promoter-binding protein isoform X1 [Hydra vulgaris]|uniref:C-myc promoter-binding protein isoform X1 n=1 Tax=Hydra vulgaris TaxID=6087 RepID=UPI001F5F1C8A|nr:C-myc promoter-binding protein [Hydra vulgaris]XP_047139927.1 C-myc promoter-binding protein [Hydra vulgaris]
MIEEHRVADYFVTVGLNNLGKPECDYETLEPITDLAVIFKSAGEEPPDGFECIETTPSGLPANLNHGSLRSPTCYLCFRRGRDKPPLTDIGVLHEGRQRLMHGCDIVLKTPSKLFANVNNASNSRLFITYRRASPQFAHSSLAVIDICVIITNKGEKPPHAFCLIDRNLNQGLGGSAVYLCYRKSLARTNSLTYSAEIISKYPTTDYKDYPLPDSVQLFCLPLGAVIECWPETAQPPLPIFSTFALTDAKGEKIYGAGVTFFEEFPKENFTEEVNALLLQQQKNYKDQRLVAQTNKCICLLSRYPFFDAFRRFLMALYRISVSGKQNIPIERYISHFMHNVPFPTPRKPRVFVQMTHEGFEITEPSNGPLPVSGASYTALLRCLGTENTLTLLACILTEQKILVHSLRPALLTSVGEALTSLIFPFQWKCPYIPLCPLVLADVLSAPFPFIYGIDSRYFDQGSPPCDVTCVDLDTNMITQASETRDFKQINWKSLPKKPCKVLKDKLDEVFLQLHNVPNEDNNSAVEMAPLNVDSVSVSRKENIEVDIQEAFLRFHAQILQGYDQYLLPITSRPNIGSRDLTTLFDLAGFMKSRPRGTEKFFQLLTRTQLFNHFVEIRSLSSSNDAVLMFFDECIDKCDTPARLLHNERFSNSFTTVVVTPPDKNGLPKDDYYIYNGFPKFKPELFIQIPSSLNNTSYSHLNTPPRSPVVGRTKHEREQGSVSAKKQANSPMMWARCLLGHCYTIWFIQLPAFVKYHHDKKSMLYTAFDILQNISKSKAKLPDEVCFRVLMQLSGQFNHPALAVKVLFEMKRIGLQPNAVTWGYYHRAVLEGEWQPEELRSSPQKLWNKARIVFSVIHAFKKSHKDSKKLVILNESEDDLSRVGINPIVNTLIQLETESVGAASDGGYSSELLSTEDLTRQQPVTECLIEFGEEPKKSLSSNNIVSLKKHIRNLSMSSQISDNEIINQIKINKLKETSRSLSTSMVDSQTTSLEKMWNNNLSLGSSCPKSFYVQKSPISLEAVICSSQICSTCDKIIYDEEVMGAWSADDSNLNILCPFCQTKRVPMLEIKLKDYSQNLGSRNNIECKEGCVSNQNSFSLSSLSDSLVSKVPSEKETSSIQQLEDFFSSSLDQLPGTSAKPASVKHESALNSLNTVEDNFNACSSPSHSSSGAVGTPQRPLIVKHRKTISNCSTGVSSFLDSPVESESCSVPYLSPLVLRKEVENLLENNGDHVLQTAEIVKEKPILFWNMVWYFRRLALPSHLPMLLSASRGKHISLSSNEVVISTSWDMNRQTNSTVPLYMLWNLPEDKHYLIADHNWTPYNTLKTINLHVQKNDIMEPIKILLEERSRQQKENPNLHWSLYRELMFLSLVSCGEDNIDIDAFDREYKIAYKEMHRLHSDRLYPDDKSPTVKASFCRKAFQPPTLQPRNPKLILM